MHFQRRRTLPSAILCLALQLLITADGKITDHITPCDYQNPAFNVCLLETAEKFASAIAAGTLDLGIPPGDPFFIPRATVYEFSTGMNLTLANTIVTGLSTLHFIEASADPQKYKMRFVNVVPHQSYVSDYVLLDRFNYVVDSGKSNATFYNTKVTWDMTGRPEIRDGVTYMRLATFDVTAEPAYVDVELSELFSENQLKTRYLNRLLKVNWKEVYNFVKPELEGLFGRTLSEIIDHIFAITPYDQIFANAFS